jgi:hypothetical protein
MTKKPNEANRKAMTPEELDDANWKALGVWAARIIDAELISDNRSAMSNLKRGAFHFTEQILKEVPRGAFQREALRHVMTALGYCRGSMANAQIELLYQCKESSDVFQDSVRKPNGAKRSRNKKAT